MVISIIILCTKGGENLELSQKIINFAAFLRKIMSKNSKRKPKDDLIDALTNDEETLTDLLSEAAADGDEDFEEVADESLTDDMDNGFASEAEDQDEASEQSLKGEDFRVEGTTIIPIMSDSRLDTSFDRDRAHLDALPLVPVNGAVLLPGMTLPLQVGRRKSLHSIHQCEQEHTYFGVVLQTERTEGDPKLRQMASVGCLAEVFKVLELPDGSKSVVVSGRRPFRILETWSDEEQMYARVELMTEKYPRINNRRMKAVVSNIREDIMRIARLIDTKLPGEISFAFSNVHDNNYLVNFLCSTFPLRSRQRQHLLEEMDVYERALRLASYVHAEMQFAKLRNEVAEHTNQKLSEAQRQTFLQQQMQAIQEQLGQTAQSDVERLTKLAEKKHWTQAASEAFAKELAKLQRMSEQHPDYSISLTYLQNLVDLPWGTTTTDNLDLLHAERVLNRDHYGLEKVKERILEHLAVMKMRGLSPEPRRGKERPVDKSPILCLFGPPGVGKTSLGKSVARALGREYVRISLGGLHDEAEIRGHRRTYIGAMPGRIVGGILKAKTDNPVFVLDEIDKIGADFHGDPAAAMLEVLDPEQNSAFHDNYLDLDYDLSKVLFIATANSLATISEPLRDRMEIIDLSGYILEEKVEIAERHLLPKQKEEHGLASLTFSIPRPTMQRIVEQYTREAGVRLLDKRLAKIMRRVAHRIATGRDVPRRLKAEHLPDYLGTPDYDPDRYEGNDYAGVVTGLAWTSVGGTILCVEAALCKGKGEKLTLTGHLGDVMKESAMLALQYVRAHADELGIDERIFNNYTVHIHCPEGAIPKDGPSAGITMATALASVFTQRRVRPRIAMTGELTLRGRVLPIGGVKEKILAARRAGITDLVLCEDNRKDVEEVKADYLTGLTFHYVRDVRDVLAFALLDELVPHPMQFDLKEGAGAK